MKPKYRARYTLSEPPTKIDYSAYIGSATPGFSSTGVMSHDSNPVGWLQMKIIFGIPGLLFLGLLIGEVLRTVAQRL